MKQIAISRLRAFVLQGVKITEPELQMEYFERAAKEGKRKTQADFVKDRAAFFEQLRQEKGAQVLNRWYAQIGTNLKVKVHLEEIEKRRPS
jgi:hypothetical protein